MHIGTKWVTSDEIFFCLCSRTIFACQGHTIKQSNYLSTSLLCFYATLTVFCEKNTNIGNFNGVCFDGIRCIFIFKFKVLFRYIIKQRSTYYLDG